MCTVHFLPQQAICKSDFTSSVFYIYVLHLQSLIFTSSMFYISQQSSSSLALLVRCSILYCMACGHHLLTSLVRLCVVFDVHMCKYISESEFDAFLFLLSQQLTEQSLCVQGEEDVPPRPPLPQLYSPDEHPPAVPPLPRETTVIRHTSVRGLKRQSDERKRDREIGQYTNGDTKVCAAPVGSL